LDPHHESPTGHTDLGNARRLITAHGEDLRYAPEHGQWLVWDGARWREDVTGDVHRRAKQVVDHLIDEAKNPELSFDKRKELVRHWERSQHASRLAAMVEVARTEPCVPVTVDMLDADPWSLNLFNGIL